MALECPPVSQSLGPTPGRKKRESLEDIILLAGSSLGSVDWAPELSAHLDNWGGPGGCASSQRYPFCRPALGWTGWIGKALFPSLHLGLAVLEEIRGRGVPVSRSCLEAWLHQAARRLAQGVSTGGGALEPSWPSSPSCPGWLHASALALTSLSLLPLGSC